MFRNFKFLVAVILVVAIEAAGINYLGRHNILPEGSEHWTEDWLIHYFSKREKAPNKDIVLVLINDETLEKEKLGPSLPVDRGWMAKLVKAADDAHPKAMAFDFYYASPIDPAKDEQLVSELRNARAPIVLAALDSTSLTTETQRQFLKDFIKRTGRVSGHIYIKQSNEVLLSGDRAARLIDHEPSKDGYPSFVSAIANLPAVIETYGKRTIPEGPQRIDWLLPPEKGNTFERISAYQIMSGDPVILDKLKNKIVLIGPDFPNADRHFVPFTVGEQVKYPGLFVHAQALAQILDNRFFYNWTGAGEFLLLFSIGLFGALIGAAFHGHWLAVGLGVIGSLVAIGASIPLFMIHIALPTALVILIWVTALPTGQHLKTYFVSKPSS